MISVNDIDEFIQNDEWEYKLYTTFTTSEPTGAYQGSTWTTAYVYPSLHKVKLAVKRHTRRARNYAIKNAKYFPVSHYPNTTQTVKFMLDKRRVLSWKDVAL